MSSENNKKGFAGLDSMVSEVDAPVHLPPPKKTAPQVEPQKKASTEPQVYQGQPSSSSGSDKWWAIGIGVLVLFVWGWGSGSKSSTRSPSYAAAPAPALVAPPAPSYAPAPLYEPPAAYSTQEEKPPVGSGLSFSRNQICYCLSEKIRIEAWQNKVNQYSESSVDAFNFAVNDYNARCSNFRYRSGLLEGVRSEVEAKRYVLAAEGKRKALLNP